MIDEAATKDRLGRPVRDLRLSVTDRCNFRCPYCMPAEVFGDSYRFLPRSEILTFEEIERVARAAVALGVRKLRVTGGEPLLRAELETLVAKLAAIEGLEDLSLTTNGQQLAGRAASLAAAGLRRVTVSMDSLEPEVFAAMSGRKGDPRSVLDGIEAAAAAGLGPIKVNCVVKRGANEHTLVELARHFRGSGVIVRFIEYMDVGTLNGWELADVVPAREILDRVGAAFPLEPVEPNYAGEVARRYRYRDGAGEIGVIASVTQPFCGGCTRARLSSDGKLVTCLFATSGHDLRALLRSDAGDAGLRERLAAIWGARADRYSEIRTAETRPDGRIEMFHIGG